MAAMKAFLKIHAGLLACLSAMFTCAWNETIAFAILPYIQDHYDMTYLNVATIYAGEAIGFLIASILTYKLTIWLGRTKVLVLGAGCQALAQIVLSISVPFPLFPIMSVANGIGRGFIFAIINAFMAGLPRSHEKIGFLHASYGLGSLLAPLAATPMVSRYRFNYFYTASLGLTLMNALILYLVFSRHDRVEVAPLTSSVEKIAQEVELDSKEAEVEPVVSMSATEETTHVNIYKLPAVWLFSLLYFLFVGGEYAFVGWVLKYLIDVRGGGERCGYVLSAFFACFTIARIVLPRLTSAIGEKLALVIYQSMSIGLAILLWRIRHLVADGAIVAIMGLTLGPQVPTLLVFVTRSLPTHLHIQVIGFCAAFGMAGSGVFPFVVGALSNRFGITILPAVGIVIMASSLCATFLLPGKKVLKASLTAESKIDTTV